MTITRETYKSLYPQLMRYALSLCKDRALAEELVSQTMLKAVESLGRADTIEDLCAWCITVLKTNSSTTKKEKEDQLDDETPQDQNLVGTTVREDPLASMLYQDCIERLDPDHAEVFLMNNLKGPTAKVIAEILDKPVNTILTWLSKAKSQFVDCVEGRLKWSILGH